MHSPQTTNKILIPPLGPPPPSIFSPPTNHKSSFLFSSFSTAKRPLPTRHWRQAATPPPSPAGLHWVPQVASRTAAPARLRRQPSQTHLPLACYYKKDTAAPTYRSIR